jgi:hypothetical protein
MATKDTAFNKFAIKKGWQHTSYLNAPNINPKHYTNPD